MGNKQSIGFAANLIPLILNKTKTLTYRKGDKYDFLEVGGEVDFRDSSTDKVFGKLKIKEKDYTTFKDLPIDRVGHEAYQSKQDQKETFEKYYGEISDSDPIIVISFELMEGN